MTETSPARGEWVDRACGELFFLDQQFFFFETEKFHNEGESCALFETDGKRAGRPAEELLVHSTDAAGLKHIDIRP